MFVAGPVGETKFLMYVDLVAGRRRLLFHIVMSILALRGRRKVQSQGVAMCVAFVSYFLLPLYCVLLVLDRSMISLQVPKLTNLYRGQFADWVRNGLLAITGEAGVAVRIHVLRFNSTS